MIQYIIEQIEDKYDTYLSEDEIALIAETLDVIEEVGFIKTAYNATKNKLGNVYNATKNKLGTYKDAYHSYKTDKHTFKLRGEEMPEHLRQANKLGRRIDLALKGAGAAGVAGVGAAGYGVNELLNNRETRKMIEDHEKEMAAAVEAGIMSAEEARRASRRWYQRLADRIAE